MKQVVPFVQALIEKLEAFLPLKDKLIAETDAAFEDDAPEGALEAWLASDPTAYETGAREIAEKAVEAIFEIDQVDPLTRDWIYDKIYPLQKTAYVLILDRKVVASILRRLTEWVKTHG